MWCYLGFVVWATSSQLEPVHVTSVVQRYQITSSGVLFCMRLVYISTAIVADHLPTCTIRRDSRQAATLSCCPYERIRCPFNLRPTNSKPNSRTSSKTVRVRRAFGRTRGVISDFDPAAAPWVGVAVKPRQASPPHDRSACRIWSL